MFLLCWCLASEGIYHPRWVAIPNNSAIRGSGFSVARAINIPSCSHHSYFEVQWKLLMHCLCVFIITIITPIIISIIIIIITARLMCNGLISSSPSQALKVPEGNVKGWHQWVYQLVKNTACKNDNTVTMDSIPCQSKVSWHFIVCKMFLELHSKTMFSRTPEVDGETTKQNYRMAPYSSSHIIQIPTSPEIATRIWKRRYSHPFFSELEIFTVAAELKAFACIPSEVGARAWPL